MKFQDEFRDRELVQGLARAIAVEASKLRKPVSFMEVCGTHTMAIARFGIKSLLPDNIRLISGPGCPVCVTPAGYIDHAIALASLPDIIIATFGDLLRVPGSYSSLLAEKAKGDVDIRIVFSPLDAVKLAALNPDKKVIFLAVGFETTTPTIAGAIIAAERQGLDNFMALASNKTIPGPMLLLSSDPAIQINGYICPAHVSVVIGANAYLPLAEKHAIPCVVTGFEPADILQGISMLLRQITSGVAKVENQYSRAVSNVGNSKAMELAGTVFVECDTVWRGLGLIQGSGLRIRDKYQRFDASRMIELALPEPLEPEGCRCGEVLTGRISPHECPFFGSGCIPETPVGACMVSSEGSCAAAWRYGSC